MDYIEVFLHLPGSEQELYMAYLAELGFESFEESADGLRAYIPAELFSEEALKSLLQELKFPAEHSQVQRIAAKNWNEEWEKNFNPVEVNEQCIIRAPFHRPDKTYPYEVLIMPQMSFGTGHHATTRLMMQRMLEMDMSRQEVFDYGSGTAVLAVLASKLGAAHIDAVDHDEWAYRNAADNISLNKATNIRIMRGGVEQVQGRTYALILANINKNVIVENMRSLAGLMAQAGILLCSGFYDTDLPDVEKAATANGLKFVDLATENKWAVARFQKEA